MVKVADGVVAIEVDGPLNEALFFRPLGQRIRGRFDARRIRGDVGSLAQKWPDAIPGQVLGIDTASGEAFVDDALNAPENAAIRARVEKVGSIEPKRTIPNADTATWLHWIKEAVEAGLARVVQGVLPQKIDGAPELEFITRKKADPIDRLTAAIEKQNELMLKLLSR
jgi:hypothetical protein